jgi:hypothetical protein
LKNLAFLDSYDALRVMEPDRPSRSTEPSRAIDEAPYGRRPHREHEQRSQQGNRE